MSDPLNWTAVETYCKHGIKVFPIVYQSKVPLLQENWKKIATSDFETAKKLFPANVPWNIGVSLGPDSNLCDIEVDSEPSAKVLQEAFNLFGEPKTVAYQSNRGVHRWFTWNARLGRLGKSVLKWSDIECRLGTGDRGAYSVVPPSLHESGRVFYDWLPGQAPWEVPILDMPLWLEEMYLKAQETFESKSMIGVTRQGDDLCPEPGQRHPYLIGLGNLLAGALRLPHDLSEELLLVAAEYFGKVADNGMEATRKEVKDIVRTSLRPNLPHEDFPAIDFEAMREQAKSLAARLREDRIYAPPNKGIPSHVFPPFLEYLSQEAFKAQYSKDLVLMSMLGACSAAIGNSIQVRYSPHSSPLGVQIYSLGVAGASVGKSLTINHMTSPICVGDAYCTDANSASMAAALNKYPRGVLLKVTEGKELTKMLGRYLQQDENSPQSTSDNAVFLQAWSGELMKIVRKSGNMEIGHPFLSIVAAMQPYGLHGFTTHDIMDGLMQRFFIYDSQMVPISADEDSLKRMSEGFLDYVKIIDRLKSIRPFVFNAPSIDMPMGGNTGQCAQPSNFVLDREAYAIWSEYAKSKRSPSTLDEFPEGHPFQADLMRHAEMVLRVCAIFHAVDLAVDDRRWADSQIHLLPTIWIPGSVVQRAIDLVEYLWERKQILMTDIADDRFNKANPLGSVRAVESMPIYLDKFVTQRRKKLEKSLKSEEPWTLRDYYRHLGLLMPVAEVEVETMLKTGHIVHAGVRNKVNVYSFVQKEEPRND
jgi:hypothetical protein